MLFSVGQRAEGRGRRAGAGGRAGRPGQGRAGQRAGQGEDVIPTPKGLVVLLGGLGVELVGKKSALFLQNFLQSQIPSAKNLHFFCKYSTIFLQSKIPSAKNLHFFCKYSTIFLQSKIPSANNLHFSANILQFFCNPKFHLHCFCTFFAKIII